MSNARVIEVELVHTPERDQWQITVYDPKGKEISAQDLIDAVADVLLNEGELDVVSYRSPEDMDS